MASLPDEWKKLLSAGMSFRMGSCDRHGRPGICRALACEVLPDERMRVLVAQIAGPAVIEAIRDTGRVALVMSLPETMRGLQVKGRDAAVDLATEAHLPLLHVSRQAFGRQIEPFGFPRGFLEHVWFDDRPEALRAVTFTIDGAWNTTPGPGAGESLELNR